MLLLIDIGNSNITAGFAEEGVITDIFRLDLTGPGEVPEKLIEHADAIFTEKNSTKLLGSVLSSVVPKLSDSITKSIKDRFGVVPLLVSHELNTGLKFEIDSIETLGADRIANAVAANMIYQKDVIIIDFGSATTLCLVMRDGTYKGGAIMPGIGMGAEALSDKTAGLPRVNLEPVEKALGKNTVENILSGLIIGHSGAVERIADRIIAEENINAEIVITGGYSKLLAPNLKTAPHINPLLTLQGLNFIYDLNS